MDFMDSTGKGAHNWTPGPAYEYSLSEYSHMLHGRKSEHGLSWYMDAYNRNPFAAGTTPYSTYWLSPISCMTAKNA